MNFIDFIKPQVEAHPLSREAYKLASKGDLDGLVALYERDKHLWPVEPMACKKGCALCCSLNVEIMDYEKPTLRRALDKLDPSTRREVFDKASKKYSVTRGLKGEPLYHKRIPCALLGDDNNCLIYDDRPISCRAFYSKYLEICKLGAVEGSDVESIEWRWPKETKAQIELAVGLYELEHGKDIDNLAQTLEEFLTENIRL